MKTSTSIDDLYKELFDAQLEKNWGRVAKIQLEIFKHPEYREDRDEETDGLYPLREKGEGTVAENPPDVRDLKGTV